MWWQENASAPELTLIITLDVDDVGFRVELRSPALWPSKEQV
jgi:hypothetical protein